MNNFLYSTLYETLHTSYEAMLYMQKTQFESDITDLQTRLKMSESRAMFLEEKIKYLERKK